MSHCTRATERTAGPWFDDHATQPEMVSPVISPRIEEARELTRGGDRTDIATLSPIAACTSKGQIARIRCTPVFLANDVIDLTAEKRITFVS